MPVYPQNKLSTFGSNLPSVAMKDHDQEDVDSVALQDKDPTPCADLRRRGTFTIEKNSTTCQDNTSKDITMQKVREKVQILQAQLIEEMDEKLSEMVGEVLDEVQKSDAVNHTSYGKAEDVKYRNRKKTDNSLLPDKQFLPRNSLLTELFKIKHFNTIYNIFVVILLIMFLNTAVYDVVTTGRLNLGFELILWCFGELPTVLFVWLSMFTSTLALHFFFTYWANGRKSLQPKSLSQKCWDYGWLLALILYEVVFIYLPARHIYRTIMPPASAFGLLCEQVRLLMKSHAFVRTNTPRVLNEQAEDTKDKSPCPEFSKFLYFIFAPTLIYRDCYPRTKEIRWKVVVWHFLEVIGVIFYMAFLFDHFIIPMYREFGKHPVTADILVMWVFGAMVPGTMCFLCGFFCLLHSWMNAWAEMLRFADRMFYKDWWNATSYSAYFRTWNVVVHDWLYTYIYKDYCELFRPRSKVVPTMLVFAVSAIVHEYILAFAFRFFYPMLMFAFGGFSLLLVFIMKDVEASGNIIVWFLLCTGNGVLTCLYTIEAYARINCQQSLDDFWDFLVPRSWFCQSLTHHPS